MRKGQGEISLAYICFINSIDMTNIQPICVQKNIYRFLNWIFHFLSVIILISDKGKISKKFLKTHYFSYSSVILIVLKEISRNLPEVGYWAHIPVPWVRIPLPQFYFMMKGDFIMEVDYIFCEKCNKERDRGKVNIGGRIGGRVGV